MGELLDALANKGLGALQWFGETADKPGRAIRGMLGGQGLGAAKNLIPFSDTYGITDPSRSVSGRQLLNSVLGERDPNAGFGWGDAAGIGAEIALNPLSLGIGPSMRALSRGSAARGLANQAGRGAAVLEEAAPRFPGVTPQFAPRYSRPNAALSEVEAAATRGAEMVPTASRRAAPGAAGSQPVSYTDEMLAKYPQLQSINRYQDVDILDLPRTQQMMALKSSGQPMPYGLHGGVINTKAGGPVGFLGDPVNMAPGAGAPLARSMRNIMSKDELAQRAAPGLHGFLDPNTNTIVSMLDAGVETVPHEFNHALNLLAARTGQWSDLPLLNRAAASLMNPGLSGAQSTKTFRHGIGSMFDELSAHVGEVPELSKGIARGAGYMFPSPGNLAGALRNELGNPYRQYMGQIGFYSPRAESLYKTIGVSPYALGASGLGAGAGTLLENRFGGD